jgi:molybdopterin molybdotransferase
MLTYIQARHLVVDRVTQSRRPPATAPVSLWDALGYVLAEEIAADRDYPPFHRSTRDGYAVRAAAARTGATLRCAGEIKAGDTVTTPLAAGTCVQIMTGAAAPPGADAVVMIEHTNRTRDHVRFDRDARPGQNIVPSGSEVEAGQSVLPPGTRLGFAELALAAQVVGVDALPGPFQIRNSNSVSLAAQARLAGAEPVLLGNSPDLIGDLRIKIERGLKEDILVLSGGVSMGKYDLVETVLKELGAEFFFDAVAIRPGKPAVFARCQNTFVFGLPGNPVSTMVTFELFVTPALDLLSGAPPRPLPLLEARLAAPLNEKPGLTHFLPARVEWPNGVAEVSALVWQGSGDIATLARANAFLVVPPEREQVLAGEAVQVLLRKDVT